ncbi:MAG TPA: GatB/YqeY domain-containing protein [Candidatus Saccharimonadales bacterium]|nr:GatB/YqeY domain-containing protein [Candidatus Saccharimonadales bacterium]
MLEERIEQDLKAALLARDSQKVTTLRGLKSVLLNEKVAKGKRESGLSDDEVLATLSKEAKKRQESADLYVQGGDQGRADAELSEKKIIEAYLPEQLSEEEIAAMVDDVIAQTGATGQQAMGQVIGQVKQKAGAAADGAVVARIVKEKLGI